MFWMPWKGVCWFTVIPFLELENLMADKIPQQLQSLLPDKTVYNFGVAGYGLDQIYLRFKQSHDHFKKPVVIIGILTVDMDRCVMKNRSRPKPYFLIKENELVLSGVPVVSKICRESVRATYQVSGIGPVP